MGDRYHDPALVVIDAAPSSSYAVITTVLTALSQMCLAWDLEPIVQIEHGVENRILVVDLHDGAVRKNEPDALFEHFPLVVAMQIVGHEKTAAQQVIAHHLALLLRQAPL